MSNIRMGVAVCGSCCTYARALDAIRRLCGEYDVYPIMSENAARMDTRFGSAAELTESLREYSGHDVITGITGAEPIGPKKLLDVLVILPCTGNTIAKLANGVTDSAVTMAAKAQLRNGRPVVIAASTNDALSANARNIGELLNRKNIFFVPFYQDDPTGKPTSLLADFSLVEDTVAAAMEGRQIQPLMRSSPVHGTQQA